VANRRVLRESGFEELFIQPAAGDDGGALGAALYAWNTVLGKGRTFRMETADWGPEHSQSAVEDYLRAQAIPHESFDDEGRLLDRVVTELAAGRVAGWFTGRAEWGPRALGHRSILADPSQAGMKDRINRAVKFREPFRPFAPSVAVEACADYFDFPEPARHYPARFMLYVAPIRENQRDRIAAATHFDGTARFQAVFPAHNPRFYRLLRTFGHATGMPVLLNTSFNLKGEPIVNTPAEAVSTFRRSGLDLLVLGNCLLRK
jgi:carbamoyltransferase